MRKSLILKTILSAVLAVGFIISLFTLGDRSPWSILLFVATFAVAVWTMYDKDYDKYFGKTEGNPKYRKYSIMLSFGILIAAILISLFMWL